jgi:hypothetical protein
MQTLSWTEFCQNIICLLIGGDVLENYFSLLDFIMNKIVLDLNVLQIVMEQGSLAYTALIITIYHILIQHLIK